IKLGIIGTATGINHFRAWAEKIKKLVAVPPPGKGEKQDRLHLSNFPGLEEALGITYDTNEFVACTLDAKEIDKKTSIINLHEAVKATVKLYADRAKKHVSNDEREVSVWVLVLPEIIFERCRPNSKRKGLPLVRGTFGKRQKARSDLPLLQQFIDDDSEEIF